MASSRGTLLYRAEPFDVSLQLYLIAAQICAAQLGLEPGDAFEIKLGCMQIKLPALAAVEEES